MVMMAAVGGVVMVMMELVSVVRCHGDDGVALFGALSW